MPKTILSLSFVISVLASPAIAASIDWDHCSDASKTLAIVDGVLYNSNVKWDDDPVAISKRIAKLSFARAAGDAI